MKRALLLACLTVLLSGDVSSSSADSRDLIVAAAQRHGVPIALALRVAQVESQCDCWARGTHGELGPLQIKPATARMIGYQGPDYALQSCGEGLEWGMKHLAMALQRGGVWKHNQGLWAKQKNATAAKYEMTVLAGYIARKLARRNVRSNEFALLAKAGPHEM
jgi:soluble lytic murein transglycosylase-like protein